MILPSIEFLSNCMAAALLDHYGVDRLPVPIRTFITSPPPDLASDLSLTEGTSITFCDAVWVRLINGQGVVFLNGNMSEPNRRYAMACALFMGLAATKGGRAVGLYEAVNATASNHAERFGRGVLLPVELLPGGWESMPADDLAKIADVPVRVVAARLRDLGSRQALASLNS
jgi:hypothetical protein